MRSLRLYCPCLPCLLTPRLQQNTTTASLKPALDFSTFVHEYTKLFHFGTLFQRTAESRLFAFVACTALASTACVYTISAPHSTGAALVCFMAWIVLLFVYIVYARDPRRCMTYRATVTDGCIREFGDMRKVLCWLALNHGTKNETAFPSQCRL